MEEGYIKIYRQLLNNPIWSLKPFSKGQAWIDLIMFANFKDTEILLGNQIIKVERGSFVTSEIKLMERWGWSKSKVRAFLKNLCLQKMLLIKTDNKKTTISLTNYGVYQTSETTEEPVKDQQKTSKRPVKDTANKEKKEKKEKKSINERERSAPPRETKHKRGEYQHVLLTDRQLEKLKADFGEAKTSDYIRRVDEYCQQYGKGYKDYSLTIRKWIEKDHGKATDPQKPIYTFEDNIDEILGGKR